LKITPKSKIFEVITCWTTFSELEHYFVHNVSPVPVETASKAEFVWVEVRKSIEGCNDICAFIENDDCTGSESGSKSENSLYHNIAIFSSSGRSIGQESTPGMMPIR
jgi:hypothetical protein